MEKGKETTKMRSRTDQEKRKVDFKNLMIMNYECCFILNKGSLIINVLTDQSTKLSLAFSAGFSQPDA